MLELEESNRLKKRFITRAHSALWVRTSILFISALALTLSNKPGIFFLHNNLGWLSWFFLAFVLLGIVISHFCVDHEIRGRQIFFGSLLLDLIWCTYLIVFSNGLSSPLMVVLPVYTYLFSMIFPGPFTLIPPLLLLPAITAFHLVLFHARLVLQNQIGILAVYSVLNGVIIYVTNFVLSHEEKQSRNLLKLERQLKRLAILEERNRISREIHDGFGGTLSSIIIQSEYLLSLCKPTSTMFNEITELKSSAEEAIDDLRRSISMLRNDFDLVPQLQNCCSVFSSRHKLSTFLDIQGRPPTLSPEKQHTIFRIMQECLTNTSKHANAKKIDVQIRFSDNILNMKIKDDGLGFDPSKVRKNHFGLLNIQERAKKMGGYMTIDSSLGKGTCIKVTLNS